jgi:hypothetical protein
MDSNGSLAEPLRKALSVGGRTRVGRIANQIIEGVASRCLRGSATAASSCVSGGVAPRSGGSPGGGAALACVLLEGRGDRGEALKGSLGVWEASAQARELCC